MNFFEAQDRARRTSRWLVVIYFVATAIIVLGVTAIVGVALFNFSGSQFLSDPGYRTANFISDQSSILAATSVITSLFIFGSSLYKTSALSAGGGRVASQLGGTLIPADVQDPLRRRLRNVVEEMSIASGVPVPEIYVLEEESGINAFAAGFAPGDAAIAVTRGALEVLDRDELQGVVAHEFSHILNGDMRLNIRLMGILFGILVLGLIGRMIVRGGRHTSIVSSRRDRSAPVILIIGLGLAVLGAIGVFFARLIKAAVSRQREYLADASAVQFTRQNTGIANALKKIGGYSQASYLTETDPEEVSHMLFGTGSRLFGLFATHPPLTERIKALDPSFKESEYPVVDISARQMHEGLADADGRIAGFTTALASGGAVSLPDEITETVGRPEVAHIEYAKQLRPAIPEQLYSAAHSTQFSYLLTIALILDRTGKTLDSQLKVIEEKLGSDRTRLIRNYYETLLSTGPEFRLPLLEVSFPALKHRPSPQLQFLVELASRLIEIDGEVDLYEYCYYRVLMSSLGQAIDPSGRRHPRRARRRDLRKAAVMLLGLVADVGQEKGPSRDAAFRAGAEILGNWATDSEPQADASTTVQVLDRSLDILLALNATGRQRLLRAVSTVAAFDRHLNVAEAELIRTVCATLDCPLPPILVPATGN
ncbi:MAG: M48 family metallopeptidase [Gammaproteobacteria bacterium]|nr:M48 family metallopeptidase [Gammaproteobacteria bacterium]